jgi:hypothetical protein
MDAGRMDAMGSVDKLSNPGEDGRHGSVSLVVQAVEPSDLC